MNFFHVPFCYVNRINRNSNRLNVNLSESVKVGEETNYITYNVTFWDAEADYYESVLQTKTNTTPSSAVAFTGSIRSIRVNETEKGVYTSLDITLAKSANSSDFTVVQNFGGKQTYGGKKTANTQKKTTTKSKQKIEDDDDEEYSYNSGNLDF